VSGAALVPAQCYFEDVEKGVPFETPGVTLTATHVTLFAGVTGDAALREPNAVPDLLPLCLSLGLGWRVPRPPLAVLAFMGFEWRFLRPVTVGDTIHSVSRTLTKRSMREGGVVIEERRIVNQRGETVQSGRLTLLVERRPAV
jgi:3-hydroxybutyryl-CoA dehydratase